MPDNTNDKEKKNWTVMVYLAGDNNLAEEMVFALKSMYTAGSPSDNTRIVALYDSIGAVVPFDIPTVHKTGSVGGSKQPEISETIGLKALEDDFIEKRKAFFDNPQDTKPERELADLINRAAIANVNVFEQKKSTGHDHGAHADYANAASETQKAFDIEAAALNLKFEKQEKANPEFRRYRLGGSVSDTLEGFIVDTVKRDRAQGNEPRYYALILSGHGSGAVGDFLTSDKQFFGLSIRGLSGALERARQRLDNPEKWIDILGFDSCLMSMTEVAYEVQKSVKYMVGAEGYEPNAGWPYDRLLKILHGNEHIDPKSFATRIVDEHVDSYDDYTTADLSVDLAAVDLSYLDDLVRAIGVPHGRGLSVAMRQGLEDPDIKEAIILAHWEAQGYKDEQYTDLWDFCGQLGQRMEKFTKKEIAGKIKTACDKVQEVISDKKFVFTAKRRGAMFQHSHGISIFFPWQDLKDAAGIRDVDHYGKLLLPKNSSWDEFLNEYLAATRRKSRGEEEGLTPKTGTEHESFLNFRPGLLTGDAEAEPENVRLPWANFRQPLTTFRQPLTTFRQPLTTFRQPLTTFRQPLTTFRNSGGGGSGMLKIPSMKNPPTRWFE